MGDNSNGDSKLGLTQFVLSQDMAAEWSKYKNSGLLSNEEYQLINSYVSERQIAARLELLKTTNVAVVLKKLLSFHEVNVIKYVLALIDQALQSKPGLGSLFSEPMTFLALFKNEKCLEDKFISWKTCRVLSHLFTSILDDTEHEAEIKEFLDLMLINMMEAHQEALLFSLQLLLRKPNIRKTFVACKGINRLKSNLHDHDATVQVQYQTIFCLWLLSFDAAVSADMETVVTRIVEVARQSQKEKVMRISLAALRNLSGNTNCLEKMVEARLNKQLEIWNNKRWGDEDIVNDLNYLTSTVDNMIDEMSSFERYRSEVLSGDMEWTPVHFSESFWRDNITRLAEDNFHLIRVLSELLSNRDTKALTKAVACYDIGEFVRLHPAGRKVVTDLGTKSTIMGILYEKNTDAEVQKQALLCTRKMMVSNWEMVGK